MASSKVSKRRRRSSKSKGGTLVSSGRKKEVLGLILMVLALLVGLAFLTYDPGDDAIARAFTLEDALDPGSNRATNALGLVGAVLAHAMVPNFLGYTVLLLTGLIFAWGYVLLRNRTPVYLPLVTVLTVVATFALACLFGWITLVYDAQLTLWSGAVGLGAAGWMERVFGTIGSLLLLVLVLFVTSLLLVDHDIQRTMDRAEEWFHTARLAVVGWFAGSAEQYGSWREGRSLILEKKREERQKSSGASDERSPVAPSAGLDKGRPHANGAGSVEKAARPEPRPTSINDMFAGGTNAPTPERVASTPRTDSSRAAQHASEPEMYVQERIQEEKAESVFHPDDVPGDSTSRRYTFPPIQLLDERDTTLPRVDYDELEENKRILLDKLETHNIEIASINAIVGPTVTLYELTPAPGIKISRITALEDDLAMATAARGIRMIAPIPGKSAVGVEIPNRHRELVPISDVIGTAKFRDAKMELPIPIGKTIEGEVFMQDLTKLPHLLIAGATGSGKSVGLNALIAGLLYACHPANLKFVMIDPKKIELQQYKHIADHYVAMPESGHDPIITDFAEALDVLKSCEREMENRYDLLSEASVRSLREYNKKLHDGEIKEEDGFHHIPYIVVIVDELADLMMTAGKDIEGPIARLAQMARAVGIHLVLATQRPSVDVITGLIKANFPARVAYQVASKIDSRTILDQNGAEGLVGNGDLLYMMGSRIVRLQGPFVSVNEVDRIVDHIAAQRGAGPYLLPPSGDDTGPGEITGVDETDDLFGEAARIIVRSQQGSVSLLQRKLSVGYTRAARIVDQLEEAGIVGPFVGSKAREVLVESEIKLDDLLKSQSEASRE